MVSTQAQQEELERVLVRHVSSAENAYDLLDECCVVVVDAFFSKEQCGRWVDGVYRARDVWTHDFGGEQFSLGRAFYTHFEEDRTGEYFNDPKGSDARVEAYVPGLQQAMRDLVATVVRADDARKNTRVVPRRGWCGPGVHVFPPGGPVATRGGVCHFDTEGLAANHLHEGREAISVVAMLQTTDTDGGLLVWDVLYDDHDHPTEDELAQPSAKVAYRVGDVVLFNSYRLHQIQPFQGSRDRISATVHAARLDVDLWECWF